MTNLLNLIVFFSLIAIELPAAMNDRCHSILGSAEANLSSEKKLKAFFDKAWALQMKNAPEWASDLGYKEYFTEISDISLSAIQNRQSETRCHLAELKTIPRKKLSAKLQVDYDLYLDGLEQAVASEKFEGYLFQTDQMGSCFTEPVDVLSDMPKANVQHVENMLARLSKYPQKLDQCLALLTIGLNKGLTPPQVVLQGVPRQFDSLIQKNPRDSSYFKPFLDLNSVADSSADKNVQLQKRAETLLVEQIYPRLQKIRDFLVKEYIPQARASIAVTSLPLGDDRYKWAIRHSTTTTMTANEIHQLGLQEVQRIETRMEEVKNRYGFKGSLTEFNQFLRTDKKFFYTDANDLLIGFRDIAKRIDPELPRLFKVLPRLSYGVRAMAEFKGPTSPAAYYFPGSPENGRAGFFEANTTHISARPKWGMEALTLHEAVPGHHLQIALSQEITGLPLFRKHGHYTAFVEGWGLYAESLGAELGLYRDLLAQYGQLSFEIWRAIRLVVDTGMHSQQWSRDKAIEYFKTHSALTEKDIVAEVDRYIVWPGQALGYKIGQIKIRELRNLAERELKGEFDIREFHQQVLEDGAVPLNLLESKIISWVAKIKAKRKAT